MARSNAEAGPRPAPFQPPRRVEGVQNPSERNQNQPEQNQSPAERNPNPAERNPNLTSFHESSLFNGLSLTLTGSVSHKPVLRRRAKRGVSKDAPGGANEAASWTILRDAMLRIAPQDEVAEVAPAVVWITLGVARESPQIPFLPPSPPARRPFAAARTNSK